MLAALRSGSFVTRERMRVYSLLLLVAYVATIVVLLATARGIVDTAGRPIGTDFANVYAAGKLALAGEPALAYDWPAHHQMQKDISGQPEIGYFPWSYPPTFLLIAAVLAALPYLSALLIYQALALAAYLAAARGIVARREALLPALAFPAVFVSVAHGHDGLLSATLFGGALAVLDRRPLLAGALIGCLSFKLEFWPLIPFVLAVGGRWRVVAAALMTTALLAALAWAALGSDAFVAFWHSLPMTQKVALEGGRGFHKIPSIHGALRLLDVPAVVANAAQVVTTTGTVAALVALWRSTAAFELKAAGLIVGCMLASPYVLDYDLVVLAPAIAFLVAHGLREGFADWEVSVLAAMWMLPLAVRSIASFAGLQLAPILLLAAFGLVLLRAGVLEMVVSRLPHRASPAR
jgi:hypothetical protein